ncbi:plasmid mobilization protein [Croceibacterium ferulae]|uniref:plasmid mobilization protein n=1 Tax=Croceibacterium ferulae TaxID=1854641 RepID=UPI000F85ECC8|nr:hypothetical protein [Croceibacterium ferulae]
MSNKLSADTRVSVTIHVTPAEGRHLEIEAACAGLTRSGLVRTRALGKAESHAPNMAALAQLLRIAHRLDDAEQLDAPLRAELVAAVRQLAEVARLETGR